MRSNRLTLLRSIALALFALVFTASTSLATTWYVNSTNGDDLNYNGLAATASGLNVGPFQTIAHAISSAVDGDTIMVATGTYGEANVNVAKSLTFISYQGPSGTAATITNGITINGSGKTVNLGLSGSMGFNLGSTANALKLTAGTLNILSANVTIASGGTITRTNGTVNASPTVTNVNVTYGAATGSLTAGPEMPANLGSGSLTVGNTGNSVTFTSAITTTGGITVSSGGATFSGNLTLTAANLTNSGTGTVTVGGNVSMLGNAGTTAVGNIVNSNTGTLNLNGTVTFDQTQNAFSNGFVQNTSTGTINAGGSVTWMVYGTNFSSNVIDNSNAGAGTISFTGGVVFQKASTGGTNSTGLINNNGTGTVTVSSLSEVSATISGTSYTPVISVTNASSGTVNIGGTVNGAVTNDNAGTVALNSSSTFSGGVSNNNAGSIIKLGAYTLTLSGGPTVANAGHIISSTAGQIGSGTLAITTSAATINGGGELPNLSVAKNLTIGNTATTVYGIVTTSGGTFTTGTALVEIKSDLNVNSGGVTIGAGNLTVDGNINQAGGNITDGGNTLTAKGNVTMTGGTVTATGTLAFTSGTAGQTFTPTANLALTNLTVNSAGQTVTLGASVIINGNVTISAGKIDLSTYNLRMDGTGTFDNTGGYISTGGGTIIFENNGASPAVIGTIQGSGVFSNIDLRGSGGGTVQLGSAVTISGAIYLRNGDLDLNGNALTLNSSLVRPTIQKNTAPATATTAVIENTGVGGNLVTVTTDYDLTYYGGASWAIGATEYEWVPAKLHSLTIATGNSTTPYTVTPPAGAVTITGNLTVNADQTLDLANATSITASGNSASHSIVGTIANGTLDITGNSATVTGAATTVGAAAVNHLTLDGTSINVTNLQNISGNLTINKAGANVVMNTTSAAIGGNLVVNTPNTTDAVTVNMAATNSAITGNLTLSSGALSLTMGSAAGQYSVGGNLTLTKGTLTLGSNLTVVGTTGQADGSLALGANNFTVQGAYTHSGAGTVSGTGNFVIGYTAGGPTAFTLTTAVTIPNLQLNESAKANIVQLATGSVTVSNALTLTKGTLDFNALSVIVTGNTVTTNVAAAGDVSLSATGGGVLNLQGDSLTWTSNDNMTSAGALTVNSGGTVFFRSDKETASPAVARTFSFAGVTQTAGNVDLGINTLTVTGNFSRTAGNWAMSSGVLQFNSAGMTFTPGVGMSVKNLTVSNTMTLSGSNAFTVTGNFSYANAVTLGANAMLTLADGATITVANAAASLDKLPAFPADNNVNVTYNAAYTTAKELPATVNNLTTTAAVTLNAPVTVMGTFAVGGAFTNTASKNVTLASGATLEIDVTGPLAVPVVPPTSGLMNLVYNTAAGAVTTSDNDWPATASIGTVTVKGITANALTLHANRTVQGTLTIGSSPAADATQLFDLNQKTLTVLGNVVTVNGGNFASTGGAGNVVFSGAVNDTLTLDANKVVAANVNININKTNATNTVTLAGANLDFATSPATLTLTNGVLATGSNVVILQQGTTAQNQPNQGFTKVDTSYVYGNVKKFLAYNASIAISNVQFPVGTNPANGANYRPLTLYFTQNLPSSVNMTVSYVDQRPSGNNGFPITAGTKTLTGYPNFYWFVQPDVGLSQSYVYNMEAQAQGYTGYTPNQIQNIRFIRRDSGNVANPWSLQGADGSYLNATLADGSPDVRVNGVQGGISINGTLFTYSQTDRPPTFTAALGNVTKNEGDTLSFAFAATDPDLGQTVTFKTVGSVPSGAAITSSGQFSWIIGYNTGGKSYPITVQAVGSGGVSDTTDTTFTVTVVSAGKPSFTAAGAKALPDTTIKYLHPLTFTYKAVDPDTGHVVTYALVGAIDSASITSAGVFTWNPTFAQIGMTDTVTVIATDTTTHMTATTMAVVMIGHSTIKGDVSLNGTVSAFDASLVLMYSVGDTTLNAEQLWAGDVSGNGQVTAFDASLILRYVAGDTSVHFAPMAKKGQQFAVSSEVSTGTVALGAPASDGTQTISLPVALNDAHNVNSLEMSLTIGQAVSVQGVTGNVPSDWQLAYHVNNGILKIAMAGVSPLSSGNVATIQFKLADQSAKANVVGSAMINENDMQSLSSVEVKSVPTTFALDQNYPNPFNPTTTIKYQIAKQSDVRLQIYSITGQLVRTITSGVQQPGYYSVIWNGLNNAGEQVSSGVYFYRLETGAFVSMKKMLLLK